MGKNKRIFAASEAGWRIPSPPAVEKEHVISLCKLAKYLCVPKIAYRWWWWRSRRGRRKVDDGDDDDEDDEEGEEEEEEEEEEDEDGQLRRKFNNPTWRVGNWGTSSLKH